MKLRSLNIERVLYGENEGRLVAKIRVEGKDSDITMRLPDEVGDKVLQLAKQAIIDAVEKTANDFIFELTTTIPETLQLKKGGAA